MSAADRISVVIPVHNGASFLAEAVASLREQTYDDVEVIVVDDGSTDGSADVARDLDVDRLVVLPENQGVSTARNIGAALASGAFLTFQDVDDCLVPDKLRRQHEHLVGSETCDVVVTGQVIRVEPGVTPPRWVTAEMLERPPYLPISALFRTSTFLATGGFDPTFRTSEDMELLFRFERAGRHVDILDEPLVVRRIHGANATYQMELMQRDLLRATVTLTHPRQPRASAIIAVRNTERYLAEAVASIRAQTVDGIEVIVVDSESTDGTFALASSLRPPVTLVSQPEAGIGPARNHGLLLARAPYVAFLDADDVWVPDKLVVQLRALDDDPELECVFGAVEEFVSPDFVPAAGQALPRPAIEAHVASSLLIRRAAFERTGPFPVGAASHEWLEWYGQAVDAGLRIGAVPQLVARRRLHDDNFSRRNRTLETDYFRILKQRIDRQAADQG